MLRVFVDDGIKATAKHRPALKAAEKALKDGDAFVVWAIDGAFRSTLEAIVFLEAAFKNEHFTELSDKWFSEPLMAAAPQFYLPIFRTHSTESERND